MSINYMLDSLVWYYVGSYLMFGLLYRLASLVRCTILAMFTMLMANSSVVSVETMSLASVHLE